MDDWKQKFGINSRLTYMQSCSARLYGSKVALKWGASDDWRATKHGVGGHGGKRQCKTRKQSGGDHMSGFVLCYAQARIVTRHCEGAKSQFKVMNHKSKGPIQALFGSLMIGSEMTQDKQCIVSFKFPDWDVLKNLSDFEDLAGGVLGCSQASLSSPYHSSWSIARVCITTDPPIWPDSINITFPPAVKWIYAKSPINLKTIQKMFILQCNENPILSPRFQPDPLYARTLLPFQKSLLIWRRRERTQIPSLCKVLSSERGLCKAAANKAHLWLRTVSGRFLVTPVTCSILLALQMPLSFLLPRSQYASYTRQLRIRPSWKVVRKEDVGKKGAAPN